MEDPDAPAVHKSSTFLNRLPKKIGCSIFAVGDEMDQISYGWGVHIIEGPNKTAMGWTLVTGVLLSFVISVLYAMAAKSQEQGFGIGQRLIAVVATVMGALYFQWTET